MLKVLLCLAGAGCLFNVLGLMWLGVSYEVEGYGLHPVICGVGVVSMLFIGYGLCCLADRCDELE